METTNNYPDWGNFQPEKVFSPVLKMVITALFVAGLLGLFQFIVITSNYFGTNEGNRCVSVSNRAITSNPTYLSTNGSN